MEKAFGPISNASPTSVLVRLTTGRGGLNDLVNATTACLYKRMGATNSLPSFDNDYELVIRVSKELEHALSTILDRVGPAEDDDGGVDEDESNNKDKRLKKMIQQARRLFPNDETCDDMERLADLRNSLVHDEDCFELTVDDRDFIFEVYPRVFTTLDEYEYLQHNGVYSYRELAIHMCRRTPSHFTNDFELVIRASKQLESSLIDILGLRGNRWKPCLSMMINQVKNIFRPDTIGEMETLSRQRNRIVHEYGVDELLGNDFLFFTNAKELVNYEIGLYKQKQFDALRATPHMQHSLTSLEGDDGAAGQLTTQALLLLATDNEAPTRQPSFNRTSRLSGDDNDQVGQSSCREQSFGSRGCVVTREHNNHYSSNTSISSYHGYALRARQELSLGATHSDLTREQRPPNRTPDDPRPTRELHQPANQELADGAVIVAAAAMGLGAALYTGFKMLFPAARPAVQRNFCEEPPAPKRDNSKGHMMTCLVLALILSLGAKMAGVTYVETAGIAILVVTLSALPYDEPIPLPIFCQQLHPARCHRLLDRHTNFSCNVCKKKFDSGAYMFGCQECNWDVCHACSQPWAWSMRSRQLNALR